MYPICRTGKTHLKQRSVARKPSAAAAAQLKLIAFDSTCCLAINRTVYQTKFKKHRKQMRLTKHSPLSSDKHVEPVNQGYCIGAKLRRNLEKHEYRRLSLNNNCSTDDILNRRAPNSCWRRNSVPSAGGIGPISVNSVILDRRQQHIGGYRNTSNNDGVWSLKDRITTACAQPSYRQVLLATHSPPSTRTNEPIFVKSGSFPLDNIRRLDVAMDTEDNCRRASLSRQLISRSAMMNQDMCSCSRYGHNHQTAASAPPVCYNQNFAELLNNSLPKHCGVQAYMTTTNEQVESSHGGGKRVHALYAVKNDCANSTDGHFVTRICRSVPVEFAALHRHINHDLNAAAYLTQPTGMLVKSECDHLMPTYKKGPNHHHLLYDENIPVRYCSYKQYICEHIPKQCVNESSSSNNNNLRPMDTVSSNKMLEGKQLKFCNVDQMFDCSLTGNSICNHIFNGDSVKTVSSHSHNQSRVRCWHPCPHQVALPTAYSQFTDLKHAHHRSLIAKRSVSECLPSHMSLTSRDWNCAANPLMKEFHSKSDDFLISSMGEINPSIMFLRPRPSLTLFSTTSDDSFKYSESLVSSNSHGFAKSSCSDAVIDGRRVTRRNKCRRRRRYKSSKRRGIIGTNCNRDSDEDCPTASDDSDEYDQRRKLLNLSTRQRCINGKPSYVKGQKRLRYLDQTVEYSDEVAAVDPIRHSVAPPDEPSIQVQSTKSPPTGAVDESDDQDSVSIKSPSGRFIRLEEIGRGSFKTVYKGLDSADGVAVAWCELQDVYNRAERMRFREEVKLLKELQHPNIVRFFDHWVYHHHNRRIIVLVTELMTSGSLKAYLRNFKSELNPKKLKIIKSWCRQILQGLAYMHSRKPPVIHRDLKCDNIFISGTTGSVKIGDLGLAVFKTETFAKSMRGTVEFMAPEMFDELYDEMVDVYSFGLCVLELVSGEYPYMECRFPTAVMKKVISGLRPDCYYKVKVECVREIIDCCIRKNKNERLSAKDLLKHSFFMENNGLVMETVHPSNRRATLADRIVEFKLKIEDSSKRVHSLGQSDALAFKFDVQLDNPEKICAELLDKKLIFEDDVAFVAQSIRDKLRALHYEQLDELEKLSAAAKGGVPDNGINNKVNASASTCAFLASNGVSKSPEAVQTTTIAANDDEKATVETCVNAANLDQMTHGDVRDKLPQMNSVTAAHTEAKSVSTTASHDVQTNGELVDKSSKSVDTSQVPIALNNLKPCTVGNTSLHNHPSCLQPSPQPALNIQEAALIAANVASNRFTVVPHSMKTGELEFTSGGDRSDDQLYGMQSIKLSQIKRVQITVISIAKNQVKCLFEIPGVFIEFLFDRARFKPEIVGSVLSSMIVKRSTREDIDHYKIPLTMSCIECLNDIVKSIGSSTNGEKRVITGGNVFTSEVKLDSNVPKLNADKIVDSIKHNSNSYKQSFVVSKMNVDKDMIGVPPSPVHALPNNSIPVYSRGLTTLMNPSISVNGGGGKPCAAVHHKQTSNSAISPSLLQSTKKMNGSLADVMSEQSPPDCVENKFPAKEEEQARPDMTTASIDSASSIDTATASSSNCSHHSGSATKTDFEQAALNTCNDSTQTIAGKAQNASSNLVSAVQNGLRQQHQQLVVDMPQHVLNSLSAQSMPCRPRSCLPTLEHSSVRLMTSEVDEPTSFRGEKRIQQHQANIRRSSVPKNDAVINSVPVRRPEQNKCPCHNPETVPLQTVDIKASEIAAINRSSSECPLSSNTTQQRSTAIKSTDRGVPTYQKDSMQQPSKVSAAAVGSSESGLADAAAAENCLTGTCKPGNKSALASDEGKVVIHRKDSSPVQLNKLQNAISTNAETCSVGVVGGACLMANQLKNCSVSAGQTEPPQPAVDSESVKMNKTTGYQQDLQQLDKNLKQALGRPKPSDSVNNEQKDGSSRERNASNDNRQMDERSLSDEAHRRGAAVDSSLIASTSEQKPNDATAKSQRQDRVSKVYGTESSNLADNKKAPVIHVKDRFTVIPLCSDIATPTIPSGKVDCQIKKKPFNMVDKGAMCCSTATAMTSTNTERSVEASTRIQSSVTKKNKKNMATQTALDDHCCLPSVGSYQRSVDLVQDCCNLRRPPTNPCCCNQWNAEEEEDVIQDNRSTKQAAYHSSNVVHWPDSIGKIDEGPREGVYMHQMRFGNDKRSADIVPHFVPQALHLSKNVPQHDCYYDEMGRNVVVMEQFANEQMPPRATLNPMCRRIVREGVDDPIQWNREEAPLLFCAQCKTPVVSHNRNVLKDNFAEKAVFADSLCQLCGRDVCFSQKPGIKDDNRPFQSCAPYSGFVETSQPPPQCCDRYSAANKVIMMQTDLRDQQRRAHVCPLFHNCNNVVTLPAKQNYGGDLPAAVFAKSINDGNQLINMPSSVMDDTYSATTSSVQHMRSPYFCTVGSSQSAGTDRGPSQVTHSAHSEDSAFAQPWRIAYDVIDRQKQELFCLLSEHRQQIDGLLTSLSVGFSRRSVRPDVHMNGCTCLNCCQRTTNAGAAIMDYYYCRPNGCQQQLDNLRINSGDSSDVNLYCRVCPDGGARRGNSTSQPIHAGHPLVYNERDDAYRNNENLMRGLQYCYSQIHTNQENMNDNNGRSFCRINKFGGNDSCCCCRNSNEPKSIS